MGDIREYDINLLVDNIGKRGFSLLFNFLISTP